MADVSTELKEAYYNSIKELKRGQIVKGTIIALTSKEVMVDVGYKSEGIILRDEFDGQELEEGQKIDVSVENVEDDEGRIILSYKKAREKRGWITLSTECSEGDIVEGKLHHKVKGGYIIDVFGAKGFLPRSLSAFRNLSEEEISNNLFKFQIIKISPQKKNFILSRRDAIKLEKEESRKEVWDNIKKGETMKGKVKSITNFGVFIDLGGVDGLLHIADMSWKKIAHPSEIVAVGDEIEVLILDFDKENNKISLGLKQMTPDPWTQIEQKYPEGSVVQGRITNIQNYGIFVELEKGIEGLVHISEISWTKKFINLKDTFAIGDTIEVKVLGVDPGQRKISLSIKQLEKDPWEDIDNLITIDSTVKGKVLGFGNGCAFIELENGLEGVIYNEDISWTKRVARTSSELKKSHTYQWKVLGLDRRSKKVILGRKQLEENPWPKIIEKFPVGKIVEAEVVKKSDFGLFVKLEEDLEGLIYSSQINQEETNEVKVGDKIKVKIIKVDPATAKIGLATETEGSKKAEEEK
ncbi:MAG: S1 RNA-binding domain-containing protein [Candidatus Omnitrophica bacterium]|nr:S1 RNA-binding domain-containing protein [Candidatus Omnitrophota bacterium]MCF7876952.1 S1 RNA-binding domain-containing protein [Candidatus Omnitrophota bacterium]MCF7878774.1 S1 RNA-binding domain-containing protein [Candidatus Omnitrophota bacterium]MCF7893129.1 S1 RNA-binding domain-containing protein [Candidatus Omnitrophota bacterium]